MNEPRINLVELTVSELSLALKRTVEDAYGYVRVRGELGNVKYHSSGHIYLDLKDDKACLAGVIWRTATARIKLKLEAGLEVVVTGRITTYPGQSKYQIVIETLAPAGVGALMALLDERKKKLAAEGLFDAARKQLLPFLPTVIGVVTSPTGAVIRDILHRLADRFPRHVVVWPVKVQGEGSAAEVAAAIRGFNALPPRGPVPKPDLIIVARGGGSLEDLWSFNEEIVVRAAAESLIPLVSAVGHETDVTLIDFAADRRAPTPSAAAEMAVPVRSDLLAQADSLGRRVLACWQRAQEARRNELRAAVRALPSADALFALPRQRLDHAALRLPRALIANAQSHQARFSRVAGRFGPLLLRARVARAGELVAALGDRARRADTVGRQRRCERLAHATLRLRAGLRANAEAQHTRIARARERTSALSARADRAMRTLLHDRATEVARCSGLLNALSHHAVLARGFALVRDLEGRPLRTAAEAAGRLRLDIEFADGRLRALTDGAHLGRPAGPIAAAEDTAYATSPRPRRRSTGGSGQGSLFDP
jgi:exodeoxyribonuclease VII large subunit